MKVSFDGARRIATDAMNKLYKAIEIVERDGNLNEELSEHLKENFNQASYHVDNFNSMFDPNCEDDINDLSDEIECKQFDFSEEIL